MPREVLVVCLVLVLLVQAGSGLRLPRINAKLPRIGRLVILSSSDDEGAIPAQPAEPPATVSIEEDISSIFKMFLKAEAEAKEGMYAVPPSVLTDNAPFLTKGRIYEKVVKTLLTGARSAEEVSRLEKVDSFLYGFVRSERKSRARLKVNYIIAGATTGRLDESIDMLHEADEIDEELLLYINGLINKQLLRSGGPAAESEDELVPGSSGKNAVDILKLINKRLEAQLKAVNGKKELLLLAKLMSIEDPQTREDVLKSRLKKVEDMDNFAQFVAEGIEHLTMVNSSQGKIEMSLGKIEKMKDILLSTQQMLSFYSKSGQDELFTTESALDPATPT